MLTMIPLLSQRNNFEFSKPMQFGGSNPSSNPSSKPFSSLLSKKADSARTPDQRPALSEEPVTPGSVVSESKGALGTDAPAAPAVPRAPINWADILLWKEPLQSFAMFVTGLLAFGLVTFAAYGAHRMTLVSGALLNPAGAGLMAAGFVFVQCICIAAAGNTVHLFSAARCICWLAD